MKNTPRSGTTRSTQRKSGSPPSLSFKKVLVPVDFSESSRAALQYAIRFAMQHGSELILLHVVEPVFYPADLGYPSLAAMPSDVMLAPQMEYKQIVQRRLEDLQNLEPKTSLTVSSKTRLGQPYAEITSAAKEWKADLIIISTHGHTGLKHVLLGSTAERVVRHASVPVLTIRAASQAPTRR